MRRVEPEVYTKKYYLTDCTGHEEFKRSYGKKLDATFKEISRYLSIKQGMHVLDIGCGRGEIAFYCASKGAKVIGIDYSNAAIKLANHAKLKQSKKIQKNVKFKEMDAKKLKFSESMFDLIIMTGVVEHLYPEELEIVFSQTKTILKPNGKLIVHTAPNKIFNDIAYKFYCYPMSSLIVSIWNKIFDKRYSNIAKFDEIRKESHRIMHVNEPTFFSLNKLFNKYHFKGQIMSTNMTVIKQKITIKDILFNFSVFLHPFSKKFPLNILFGSDFISVLINKK